MIDLTLNVNGKSKSMSVEGHETLLDVLRTQMGLTGSKRGCNQGVCGSCNVLLDGKAARSCLFLAAMAAGRSVVTIEGLADDGKLTSVQQAFVDTGAIQCGFCMPGMVVAATALLAEDPCPDDDAIREGLAGNLCRCSGYVKVAEAVRLAANIAGSEG